jgi:hypothetical protein
LQVSGVRKCRSCGATIEFARNERTGRLIPLDVIVHGGPPANLYQVGRGEDGVLIVRTMRGLELFEAIADESVILRRPHFATCTHPEQHRRRSSRRRAA